MKKLDKLSVLALAIAVFAMFFGAGNVIFPLIIGREVGSAIPYGLLGFIITAVMVPLIGYIATIVFEGSYDNFFFRIGKLPALAVIALCMIVIGPLGASRCVIISYASVQQYLPFSLLIYSLIIAGIVFILTYKESKVVPILGRFLGPVKISLLLLIILLVMIFFKKAPVTEISAGQSFFSGLKQGYFTLDLIGGIFFSHLIYNAMTDKSQGKIPLKKLLSKGVRAGLLGGLFLAIIYSGFGIAAAIYGQDMTMVPDEQLFSALAGKILGPYGGILANITVALATLTTAIALTTVFADYLCFEIFKGKVPYVYILVFAIAINVVMENLGFSGIMRIIAPIAILIYPSFIVLSFANIFHKLWGFKYTKLVVGITFALTFLFKYVL